MKIKKLSLIRNVDFMEKSDNNRSYPYWDVYSVIVDFGYIDGGDPTPYALETFFNLEMAIVGIIKNPDAVSYFYEWIDTALVNHKLGNGNVFFLKKDEEMLHLLWDIEFYGPPLNGQFPEVSVKVLRTWLTIYQNYAESVQKFFGEHEEYVDDLPVYIAP